MRSPAALRSVECCKVASLQLRDLQACDRRTATVDMVDTVDETACSPLMLRGSSTLFDEQASLACSELASLGGLVLPSSTQVKLVMRPIAILSDWKFEIVAGPHTCWLRAE